MTKRQLIEAMKDMPDDLEVIVDIPQAVIGNLITDGLEYLTLSSTRHSMSCSIANEAICLVAGSAFAY